jgi:hypothetical protein
VALFCPKCGKKVAKNGLNCGKKWQKSGKKVAKIGQKLGKKWPILSRMGELLKGTFFGHFVPISAILAPPQDPPFWPRSPDLTKSVDFTILADMAI